MALRIGPIFTNLYTAGYIDEYALPVSSSQGEGTLIQSIRLPASECMFVPGAGHRTGHGAITPSLDGSHFSLTCVGVSGETKVFRLFKNGEQTLEPLCNPSCPERVSDSVGMDENRLGLSWPPTAAVPSVMSALGHLTQALVDAHAVSVTDDKSVFFAQSDGVYYLNAEAAADPDTSLAPLRIISSFFNCSKYFNPSMLHVTDDKSVFFSGRPPKQFMPVGHPCAAGGPAIYRFDYAVDSTTSDKSWECTGRYPRLGKSFFVHGCSLAGYGNGNGTYELFISTKAFLARCVLPAVASDTSVAPICTELVNIGEVIDRSFSFLGVAAVGQVVL